MSSPSETSPRDPGRSSSGLDLVIMRAVTDPEFRRWLLADPRAAIETTFGIQLPSSLRLRFCEKDRDVDLHVVLPDLAPAPGSLPEEYLNRVVGGHGTDPHLGGWLGSRRPAGPFPGPSGKVP